MNWGASFAKRNNLRYDDHVISKDTCPCICSAIPSHTRRCLIPNTQISLKTRNWDQIYKIETTSDSKNKKAIAFQQSRDWIKLEFNRDRMFVIQSEWKQIFKIFQSNEKKKKERLTEREEESVPRREEEEGRRWSSRTRCLLNAFSILVCACETQKLQIGNWMGR